MSWIRFSKRNPCPVCNGERSDCRQNEETQLIHCRASISDSFDYIYRGQDSIQFGMWAQRSTAEEWSEERRREWEEQKAERKRRKEEESEQWRKVSLSPKERHAQITKILNQLSLTEAHRKKLHARGLTDEQIDKANYRSVVQWQPLRDKVSDRLSGVNQWGTALNNKTPGILIPVPDENGHYVLLRVNDLTPNTENKYYPCSSASRGVKIHLPNGNQPIAIYYPPTSPTTHRIGFVEGLEYKPYLAAERLGIPIIGASGGNFANSQEAIQNAIAFIQKKYGWDTVEFILYADAGSAVNPNVSENYQKLGRFIPKLAIADWGQLTRKDRQDIDEIANFNAINLISVDKFAEKVKFEQQKKVNRVAHIYNFQEKLFKLTCPVDLEIKDQDLIDGRFLPSDLILKSIPETFSGILNLKAPKGTGKSTTTKALIKAGRKQGKRVISITPRIALGKAQAKDWGIEWLIEYHDELKGKVNKLTVYENQETLGLCFDSVWKIAERTFENTIILLDESELGLPHLLTSSTCRDNRSKLLLAFKNVVSQTIANKGVILLSDADLTDVSVNYIKSLASQDTPTFTVSCNIKPASYTAFLFKQKKWLKQEMLNAIEEGSKLAIATDSQREGEKIERELIERYPKLKIIRIDSSVSGDQWGKDFIERINESLKEERPDVFIYSPSIGTGVSIDGTIDGEIDPEIRDYFDMVFGIFIGVLPPSQCRQMLMRFRAPVDRYIYVKNSGQIHGCASFDPQEIRNHLLELHGDAFDFSDILKTIKADDAQDFVDKLQEMVDPETRDWTNPHLVAYSEFKARNNYGLAHLRELLIEELAGEGHIIIEIDPDSQELSAKTEAYLEGEKEKGEAIDREEAKEISEADLISFEQAKLISRKASPTYSERYQAKKAFLAEELPGINLTPEFIYNNIVKDKRRSLNAIKFYWKIKNPDAVAFEDKREYQAKFKQFAINETVYLPDIRVSGQTIKLLSEIGFLDLIEQLEADPTREYSKDDPFLNTLKQKAMFKRRRLRNLLGITVTKDSPAIALTNRLLEKVGFKLKGVQKRLNREKRIRVYKLDTELLYDPDRLAILQSLDQKWAKTCSDNGLNAVTESPEDSYIKTISGSVTPSCIGIEATPIDVIIKDFQSIDDIEALRWFVHGSGLPRPSLEEAWRSLPLEERRRLKPLFDQIAS